MANDSQLKNLLSYLNRHAFSKYVFSLYKLGDGIRDAEADGSNPSTVETVDLSETCGEYVFEQHHFDPPEFQGFTGIIVYTEPIDLFYELSDVNIATPTIVKNLRQYKKLVRERIENWFFPQDGTFTVPQIAFVTNYSGIGLDDYQTVLFPKFGKLIAKWDFDPELFVGSIDSFLELNPTNAEKAFNDFVSNQKDGLTISLKDDKFSVNNFVADKYIPDGVLRDSKNPCESVFIKSIEKSQAILEFEHIINRNPKESELELFLQKYYQDIFGFEYDRIETQLWLRFPDLDIAQGERRLDIFLRNSIEKDWELFEIKRAKTLTNTYRDIPVFKNEVQSAIQQLRNYSQILSQDSVKRKMAKEGIEYYVPTLKLVIGRTPNIPLAQWRWLKASNEKDVKIFTYDELLASMKRRAEYHARIPV
jgi:hypothetical protein